MLGDHKFRRTADSRKFFHMLEEKSISAFSVFELPGEKFTAQWILEHGLEHPIAINATAEDIGMKLPDRSLKVSDIAKIVGAHTQIKIIDVAQQSEINGWTFGAYAEYLENRTNAHKVLNLISLEISRTPLAKQIQGPTAMRKMDWIDVMWPLSRRARGDFPQVQKYLLTGMAESYTDFHLDFGGTSVWYHLLWGRKRFYFIAPTPENLKIFEEWSTSKTQSSTFLGDICPCTYVDLVPGKTLIIPGGWIHAVYTPIDSLAFGGNLLLSPCIIRQFQVYEMEYRTKVSKIYQFPNFREIHFYTLKAVLPVAQQIFSHWLLNAATESSTGANEAASSSKEVVVKQEVANIDHVHSPDIVAICSTLQHGLVFSQWCYLLFQCREWWDADEEALGESLAIAGGWPMGDQGMQMDIQHLFDNWWTVLHALARWCPSLIDQPNHKYQKLAEKVHEQSNQSAVVDIFDTAITEACLPPNPYYDLCGGSGSLRSLISYQEDNGTQLLTLCGRESRGTFSLTLRAPTIPAVASGPAVGVIVEPVADGSGSNGVVVERPTVLTRCDEDSTEHDNTVESRPDHTPKQRSLHLVLSSTSPLTRDDHNISKHDERESSGENDVLVPVVSPVVSMSSGCMESTTLTTSRMTPVENSSLALKAEAVSVKIEEKAMEGLEGSEVPSYVVTTTDIHDTKDDDLDDLFEDSEEETVEDVNTAATSSVSVKGQDEDIDSPGSRSSVSKPTPKLVLSLGSAPAVVSNRRSQPTPVPAPNVYQKQYYQETHREEIDSQDSAAHSSRRTRNVKLSSDFILQSTGDDEDEIYDSHIKKVISHQKKTDRFPMVAPVENDGQDFLFDDGNSEDEDYNEFGDLDVEDGDFEVHDDDEYGENPHKRKRNATSASVKKHTSGRKVVGKAPGKAAASTPGTASSTKKKSTTIRQNIMKKLGCSKSFRR